MANELPLYQRRRDPTAGELAGIPWLRMLGPDERDRAARELTVGDALLITKGNVVEIPAVASATVTF